MKLIDAKMTREQLENKEKLTPKNLYISAEVYDLFKEASRPFSVAEVLVNIEQQAIKNIKKASGFKLKPQDTVKREDRKKKSYTCTDEHEKTFLELCNSLGIKPYILRELIMLQFVEQSKNLK